MRRIAPVKVLLLSLCFALPAAAGAQAVDAGARASQPVTTAEAAPEAGAASTSGLPRQAPPPRTLRAHWHVFVAFALAWVLLLGYVVHLGRRFGALERDLEQLRRPAG